MTIQHKAVVAAAALGLLSAGVAHAQTTPGTQPGSMNQLPSQQPPTTEPAQGQTGTQQQQRMHQPGQTGTQQGQTGAQHEHMERGTGHEAMERSRAGAGAGTAEPSEATGQRAGQFAKDQEQRTSQQGSELASQETVELASMNEEQVRSLQRKLESMGLYQGEVDGIVGPATRRALRSFYQQQASLVSQGKLLAESAAAFDIDASEVQRVRGEDTAQPGGQTGQSTTRKQRSDMPSQPAQAAPRGTQSTEGQGQGAVDKNRGRSTGAQPSPSTGGQGTGSPTNQPRTGTDTRSGTGANPDMAE